MEPAIYVRIMTSAICMIWGCGAAVSLLSLELSSANAETAPMSIDCRDGEKNGTRPHNARTYL